ncbi:MAG: hypothetical protein JSW38_07710 [Dehalococcoidia bacterium]|nr:MAG: hypothetical protein JSW38_07710 [Dehalococcoidia bacterium]
MLRMILDLIKALRRNHSLEHATAAVLAGKMKPGTRIAGRATIGGFHIYGNISNEEVTQAAREGLARLKNGEHDLAVSPFCGTNLVASAVLAGLSSFLVLRSSKKNRNLHTAILASLIALVIAQPIGRLVQKHLTTSSDIASVNITEISTSGKGRLTHHKITTLQG